MTHAQVIKTQPNASVKLQQISCRVVHDKHFPCQDFQRLLDAQEIPEQVLQEDRQRSPSGYYGFVTGQNNNTWGWDINPLVPGWVPGQRKPDSQSVWFCLILEPGFLLFFGTGLIFEVPNPAAEENCLHFSIFDRKTESL